MNTTIELPKLGLGLAMCGLLFGLALGILFGMNEDLFKDFIASGISAVPDLHDENSPAKIWRYVQRAHFHAMGIAAVTISLILLVAVSSMTSGLKKLSAVLIGLGNLYPLSWFFMFLLSPSLGRSAAHAQLSTELVTYIGVGGLLTGLFILCSHLFLGLFSQD